MVISQIRGRILRQKETGTTIGGIFTLLQRSMFYIGIFNFLMNFSNFYYISVIRNYNVPIYVPAILLGLSLVIIWMMDYMIAFPSWIAFQQRQIYMGNRSPLVRDVREIKERINRIEELLIELKTRKE